MTFKPNWDVSAGEIIEEHLEVRGMKKRELAEHCGVSAKHISQICQGHVPIKIPLALAMENHIGLTAEMILCIDVKWHLNKERKKRKKK